MTKITRRHDFLIVSVHLLRSASRLGKTRGIRSDCSAVAASAVAFSMAPRQIPRIVLVPP